MAAKREYTLTDLDGKSWTFVPSIRFMMRLDRELAPETAMSVLARVEAAAIAAQNDPQSIAASQVPFPAMAYIVARMLQEAGADADPDDVYEAVMEDLQENDGAGFFPLLGMASEIIAGGRKDDAKNQQAPAETGAKKKKRAPARK